MLIHVNAVITNKIERKKKKEKKKGHPKKMGSGGGRGYTCRQSFEKVIKKIPFKNFDHIEKKNSFEKPLHKRYNPINKTDQYVEINLHRVWENRKQKRKKKNYNKIESS